MSSEPSSNGLGPPAGHDNGQEKTTICHATGSQKNPFVVITPANPGVQNGHAGHQDGRDIIPAPPGATKGPHANGCSQSTTTTTSTPPAQQAVLGAVESGGNPAGQVAGAVSGGGNPAAANATDARGELPFTGLAAAALLSIGVVLLFGGWLVRSLGLREGPKGA